jgi:glutamyl-tRNA reductase
VGLALIHREPRQADVPADVPVWRTCLREILFFNDAADATRVGQPIVEGDAYHLLLEIICGLRSPMLGETQVMGQFKTFLGTLGDDHGPLRKMGQRLLSEARIISERHLRHLGARSYGSATRRRVADAEHVAVIGTGALSQELLKFLSDGSRPVDLWGRRPALDVNRPADVTYRQLGAAVPDVLSLDATALIIAAPVASAVVRDVARRYPTLRSVVDLRGETDLGPLNVAAPVVTLAELFREVEAARRESAVQIDAARGDVVHFSRAYALRDELRPFGWEDLCA